MESIVTRVNIDSQKTELSFDEWLDRGREWWKTRGTRVLACDELLVVDAYNRVVAAGRIEAVRKDLKNASGRVSIEVLPLPDHALMGKVINRGESRNPVAFMKSSDLEETMS